MREDEGRGSKVQRSRIEKKEEKRRRKKRKRS